jgi:hypothetical protein
MKELGCIVPRCIVPRCIVPRCITPFLAATLALGCVPPGRFSLRDPVWHDPDQQPFGPRPPEYVASPLWEASDADIFRPLTRIFAARPAEEAIDVNAFDEVPDSSWFTNRLSLARLRPDELERGPCTEHGPSSSGPWTVTGAEDAAAAPVLLVRDASGVNYRLSVDGLVQGARASAAEVIVSRLYYGAGYFVPCSRIILLDRSQLSLAPDAQRQTVGGGHQALGATDLAAVYENALHSSDGRMRALLTQLPEGSSVGPFAFQGVRGDDPNDVVPHEDRRELRALRLLAAWVDHVRPPQESTLALWIETSKDQGYLRHAMVGFDDCLGKLWEPPRLARRIGYSHYFDVGATLDDWLTLGLRKRPWESARFGASGKVLGYYRTVDFEPEAWKPVYPNAAFGRMSERDAAWMARILLGFGNEELAAVMAAAELDDPALEHELTSVLQGRRDRILERYLTRVSPLTRPQIRPSTRSELCLEDLELARGTAPSARAYAVSAYAAGVTLPPVAQVRLTIGNRVCASLPRQAGADVQAPRYLIVDWVAQTVGQTAAFPARIHLYDFGDSGLRVVGLERPGSFEPPLVPPG